MKFKLITAFIASMSLVSCNNDKGDVQTNDSGSSGQSADATPSKVSESLSPVIQKFDGEKYVSTELANNVDYYIVYYTASW